MEKNPEKKDGKFLCSGDKCPIFREKIKTLYFDRVVCWHSTSNEGDGGPFLCIPAMIENQKG
jgi:hypothetical protein